MNMDDVRYTIARCPLVADWYQGRRQGNPCASIISLQNAAAQSSAGTMPSDVARDHHRLPEPWMGHLEQAPILFYSSNPGLDDDISNPSKWYPYWSVLDDRQQGDVILRQHHDDAFETWIVNGTHMKTLQGGLSHVPYWSWCKERAHELLEREPVPGIDYALTEIVHCKSRMGKGLKHGPNGPISACVQRYLGSVLTLSSSRVIVVVGSVARDVLRTTFRVTSSQPHTWTGLVGTHDRMVAFMPAPSGFESKKFETRMPTELESLRRFLRNG